MAELLSKVNCRVIIDDSACTFNSTKFLIRQLSVNEINICCTANNDATRLHADAVVASVAGKTIGSQVIDTVYMTLTLSSGVVQSPRTQVQFHTSSFSVKRQSVVSSWSFTGRLRRRLNVTRAVQPVATCRQSPYLHKPAIVIVTSSSL